MRKAIELNPELEQAYRQFIETLLRQGETEEALAVARECVRRFPGVCENQYWLGQACLQLGDYADAIRSHEEAVRINPEWITSYYSLAIAYARLGQDDKAARSRERFATLKSSEAGVACGSKVGAGACFLDTDGDLDLYCANYVRFAYENHVEVFVNGFPQYAGPKEYEPEPDVLFRNNGDGSFTDISDEAGISQHAGTGMGIVCLDYDNDGDTDIAVLNDVRGNYLFENDGAARFREVGLMAGIAYSVDGKELGSMGMDCADFDDDGWLDLSQTAYATEFPALYRNTGISLFEDVTRATAAGTKTYPYVNWGTGFADFDNDDDRDIFIANGHPQDNVQLYNHFGVGRSERIDRIEVRWIGGGTDVIEDIAVDQRIVITEGSTP